MIRQCLLALALAMSAWAPVSGQEWATRMFEATEHDFGTVARGAKAEYEFVFSNIYLEDVHVAGVRTSCGCTSVRIENASLKTYEKGAIVATLQYPLVPRPARAPRSPSSSTSPSTPRCNCTSRGYIRSDVVFEPGSVQIGDLEQGTATKQKVTVNYAGRNDWKIVDVRGTNDHLSANLAETGRNAGQVSYEMTVHVDKQLPTGYVNEYLMLVTNDIQATQIPAAGRRARPARRHGQPRVAVHGRGRAGQEGHQATGRQGQEALPHPLHHLRRQVVHLRQRRRQDAQDAAPGPRLFRGGQDAGKVNRTIKIETDLGDTTPELAAYAVVP